MDESEAVPALVGTAVPTEAVGTEGLAGRAEGLAAVGTVERPMRIAVSQQHRPQHDRRHGSSTCRVAPGTLQTRGNRRVAGSARSIL